MFEWYSKAEKGRFTRTNQQPRSAPKKVNISLVLAVLSLICFPIAPLLLLPYTTNFYYYVFLLLPSLGAAILFLLTGLVIGIVRKSKLGIGANLAVVLGFVMWGIVTSGQPTEYQEGRRLNQREVRMYESSLSDSARKGGLEARLQLEAYAEQGQPGQQLHLGLLYYEKKDYTTAYQWLYLAAPKVKGQEYQKQCEQALREITGAMSRTELANAEQRAHEWKPKTKAGNLIFGGPTFDTLSHLASAMASEGRPDEAEVLYMRTLAILEEGLGPDSFRLVPTLGNLGSLYVSQGRYAGAEQSYKRSLAIQEQAFGPDDNIVTEPNEVVFRDPLRNLGGMWANLPTVRQVRARQLDSLAGVYRITGREEEALEAERRAATVRELR